MVQTKQFRPKRCSGFHFSIWIATQFPAAFMQVVAGLDQHMCHSVKPLKYSHLDVAGSNGELPGLTTGSSVIALAMHFANWRTTEYLLNIIYYQVFNKSGFTIICTPVAWGCQLKYWMRVQLILQLYFKFNVDHVIPIWIPKFLLQFLSSWALLLAQLFDALTSCAVWHPSCMKILCHIYHIEKVSDQYDPSHGPPIASWSWAFFHRYCT